MADQNESSKSSGGVETELHIALNRLRIVELQIHDIKQFVSSISEDELKPELALHILFKLTSVQKAVSQLKPVVGRTEQEIADTGGVPGNKPPARKHSESSQGRDGQYPTSFNSP